MRPALALCWLGLLVWGCGAKSDLAGPPTCETAEDCPPLPFCGPVPFCEDGYCGIGEPRDCDDGDDCTVDACDPAAASCAHAIRDEDADGFGDISCGADDCDDGDPAVNPAARERCDNGTDDDCDGRTDCSDLDCQGQPVCEGCPPEICDNRVDDDCDELVDCDDSDCADAPRCCDPRELRCSDRMDDDCDGDVDCVDADCEGDPACCVASDELCNGLDDDCDGVPDDGIGCYTLDGAPIAAVRTETCGRAFYAYGNPDDASANPRPDVRQSDAVVVLVHEGPCGTTLSVIADTTNDGDGGELEGRLVIDPPSAAGLLQGDEPAPNPECRLDASAGEVTCDWEWFPCCTDGVMIGEIEQSFCVDVTISSPVGVRRLVVLNGTSAEIPRDFGETLQICGSLVPEA